MNLKGLFMFIIYLTISLIAIIHCKCINNEPTVEPGPNSLSLKKKELIL